MNCFDLIEEYDNVFSEKEAQKMQQDIDELLADLL